MQQYWIVIYITAAVIAAHGHVQDLRVDVIPVQARFAAAKGVNVILKYSNLGNDTMSIFKWYLPEKGLIDPLFEVTRDGEPVEYVGPLVKRRAPTADDVISLTPGTTVRTSIQLSSVYNMTQSGNYIIQYKVKAGRVLFTKDNMIKHRSASFNDGQEFVIQSTPVVVFSVGHRNLLIEQAIEARTRVRMLTPTYSSCSTSQSTAIRTAMNAALSYANNAVQYFSELTSTPRYTTWFGTLSYNNWYTLESEFTNIQNVLDSQAISFDCSCPDADSNTFAYVYGNQPYEIYLCTQFWDAPMTGIDTKGGTLIHEIAHFNIVAGTDDNAYGQSDAEGLAQSNPDEAVSNSDNFQYFAENYPYLY